MPDTQRSRLLDFRQGGVRIECDDQAAEKALDAIVGKAAKQRLDMAIEAVFKPTAVVFFEIDLVIMCQDEPDSRATRNKEGRISTGLQSDPCRSHRNCGGYTSQEPPA